MASMQVAPTSGCALERQQVALELGHAQAEVVGLPKHLLGAQVGVHLRTARAARTVMGLHRGGHMDNKGVLRCARGVVCCS